ncbi:DUF998 domain-containing protein [Naumannella sp. ID2617S]|nr:DUF998 domain-containing protein [Naumannella sp. ID2617S]
MIEQPEDDPIHPWRLLALGALLYSAWTLAALLTPELFDARISYVSELSARDQPFSLLYRSADALAGACVGFAAWRVATLHRPLRLPGASRARRLRPARVGWWALVGFGVATMADALAPMQCAPSHDLACRAAEQAGTVDWLHKVHTVTSSAAGMLLLVAIAALTWAARRAIRLHGSARRLGWVLVLSGVVGVLATGVMLYEIWVSTLLGPDDTALGWAHRTQLAAASVWLIALALTVRAVWRGDD